MNGTPLTVLALIRPGGRLLEQFLHRRFAVMREHGEWFSPAPELLGFIAELGRGEGVT